MEETKEKVSLWARLRGKEPPPPDAVDVESQFYNPLEVKIGSFVNVNNFEYDGLDFRVTHIREYKRVIGDKTFYLAIYDLLARTIDDREEVKLRLRLEPVDVPDHDSGLTHIASFLHLYTEFEYDEDFDKEVLRGEANDFQIMSDDEEPVVEAEYYRVNDIHDPFNAHVSIVQDENHDGIVEEEEVDRVWLSYWDDWRETEIEGVKETEYLYVERKHGVA